MQQNRLNESYVVLFRMGVQQAAAERRDGDKRCVRCGMCEEREREAGRRGSKLDSKEHEARSGCMNIE